jgi:DNA-directed RNA polymerase specialized sigma24 family protein
MDARLVEGTAMSEPAATPTWADAEPTVGHDLLDQLLSRIAGGDRAAFRRLYAFMAMRVWQTVSQTSLDPAVAVAVTRSTFVEVWHSAGAAARYDARDWLAAITARRANDQLRTNGARARHRAHRVRPYATPGGPDQPPDVTGYDAHIHRELAALLGGGRATIRTHPGVFVSIDDLDRALATIAAAAPQAAIGHRRSAMLTPSSPTSALIGD